MTLKLPASWVSVSLEDCAYINPRTRIIDTAKAATFLAMRDVSESGEIIGGSTVDPASLGNGYTCFQTNDVLIAKITPCFENGKGALAHSLANDIGFGSTEFHVLRAKVNVTPPFLHLITTTHRFRATGEFTMSGSAGQKRVPAEFLRSYPIQLPPICEQGWIVEIISAWDEALKKTEQLIASRVKQKAWLLTRAISASGQTTKLGAFLKQVSRPVPKPTEPYWALGIRSHGKGTFQRFVENPDSVDMEELYAVNRDDLIVNITFAWEGAIASVKPEDERCLVSHRFPSYAVNHEIADPGFVKYIVNRKAFFSQLALISPGGAGRNRVLNKKDFLKLEVPLPPLSEQKRLAQVLGTMDLLIEKETSQLSALKIQKRGLMQKLLTGQWRISIPATKEV